MKFNAQLWANLQCFHEKTTTAQRTSLPSAEIWLGASTDLVQLTVHATHTMKHVVLTFTCIWYYFYKIISDNYLKIKGSSKQNSRNKKENLRKKLIFFMFEFIQIPRKTVFFFSAFANFSSLTVLSGVIMEVNS